MYLYGKNSVFERLKANPKSIKRIYLSEDFSHQPIEELIRKKNIPFLRVSQKRLLKIKRADLLQGVAAEIGEFEYGDFDDILKKASNKKITLIFLDRVLTLKI